MDAREQSGRKVIVITGASSGIGETLARQLAPAGHTLVLAARRRDELEALAAECGGGAIAVQTDVTKRSDVDRLRDVALATFDHVDVWINNAGRGITRSVLELTDDDVDEMFLVNFKSALYGMQTIVPHFMARRQGHLINVSSLLSRVPAASFRSAYSAAKAALNIITSNLRMDLQADFPAIDVSLIIPGGTFTNFQKNAIGGARPAGGAAPPQSADDVAAVIARVIDTPVAEAYTNPNFQQVVGRYFDDVGAYERAMVV